MDLPSICEKVRVAGRSGAFLVLSIDRDTQTAELMPLDHVAPLLDAVPFSDLRPYDQDVPDEMS
jgi:hypothetical protein